ncbi:MAG: tyrosine-type recombinase/integrase [Acidimicrobiales bacterium]
MKAVLHRACRLARKWSGGTLPNPAADADLPTWRLDERRGEVRAPEPEEVRRLLAAAEGKDPRLHAFLHVLASTGIPRGEGCALRWSDLDLERGLLTADESAIAAKDGAIVKSPKTRASIRKVAFDSDTVALLERLRAEQDRLAAACSETVGPDAFVFSFEPNGRAVPHPDSFTHAMTRLRKRAGIPADIHLHSLHHFHSTAVDAVISEAQKQARLRWSTVHMARHYTDGVPGEDRRAAEHFDRLLTDGAGTSPPQLAHKPAGAGA